jgi:hypothetical protein
MSSKFDSVTRRQALAVSGSAALASLAGCSTVFNLVGDQILKQVNILNQLNHEVSGFIEIIAPSEEAVLDTSFDVPATESDGESNMVAYEDVWTAAGNYQIEVELTDTKVAGVSRVRQHVSITNIQEEMVAISVGSGDEDEPIAIRVGKSFSDFGQTNETR